MIGGQVRNGRSQFLRQQHTLRGRVVRHVLRRTGWWIFKKEHPSIIVWFHDEELARLDCILRSVSDDLAGLEIHEVTIVVEVAEYPVGTEVEVDFSIAAGALTEFFSDAEPFRWEGVRKWSDPIVASA